MSPDLKRLCGAAEKAHDASDPSAEPLGQIAAEAIVSAVLTEMRKPSAATIEAGRWPAEDDGPVACLRAMIDHILSAEG